MSAGIPQPPALRALPYHTLDTAGGCVGTVGPPSLYSAKLNRREEKKDEPPAQCLLIPDEGGGPQAPGRGALAPGHLRPRRTHSETHNCVYLL